MPLRILRSDRGRNVRATKEVPLGRSAASSVSGQSKVHIKSIILILFSSILLSLSFSSFNSPFLAWIGLVPLFFALKNTPPRQSFILSYVCGVLFFLFSMYWIFQVTPIGWIILSLYQGLYFGIFGLFFSAALRNTKYHILHTKYLILPCAWCLLEYIRANLFGGIGWNILAYSQYKQLPVIQISDITGAYGVSFLIVLVNFSVFAIISVLNDKTKVKEEVKVKVKVLFEVLAVLFIVIAVLLYGKGQISQFSADKDNAESFKVSLIQGNIEQMHKWDAKYKDYILDKYERLTLKAAKDRPDIIIWPETSIPGYLNRDSRLMRYMENLSKKTGIPILLGTPMVGIDDKEREVELNSAVLFSDKGHILQRYDKLHLVVFGEFIPFVKYMPGIERFFPITGNFTPGDEYTLFKLKGAAFGTLICFEDIFPGMVRRFVREGAEFMVNMTNDTWFGRSCAAYQHAANSVFRAIENRRPVARPANTGLTCFIDRVGRLSSLRGKQDVTKPACRQAGNPKPKELFVEGHITDTINIYSDSGLTFYTQHGDIFILFCLIIVGCFVIDYIRYRKYNN